MAFLTGLHTYTGTVGEANAYRMRGTDKIILRQKGGPSREQIKGHPNFDMTRRHNTEWQACVMAARQLAHTLHPLKMLADYNNSGDRNALCKMIQLSDTVSELGKRSVLFSEGGYRAEGFSFCKYQFFETVFRSPLITAVDKAGGTAIIELPQAEPGINLHNPKQQPMYRFVWVLGAVADVVYHTSWKLYRPVAEVPPPHIIRTDWRSWKERTPAQTIQLALADWNNPAGCSLVLGAGIEFGTPINNTDVRMVKYAGTAKILRMG